MWTLGLDCLGSNPVLTRTLSNVCKVLSLSFLSVKWIHTHLIGHEEITGVNTCQLLRRPGTISPFELLSSYLLSLHLSEYPQWQDLQPKHNIRLVNPKSVQNEWMNEQVNGKMNEETKMWINKNQKFRFSGWLVVKCCLYFFLVIQSLYPLYPLYSLPGFGENHKCFQGRIRLLCDPRMPVWGRHSWLNVVDGWNGHYAVQVTNSCQMNAWR